MVEILGVIREYLVNIGYSVDTASMDSAQKSLDQVAQSVSGFLGSVKTAAEVTGFTAAITTAVAILDQFTLGVANATLQNEIFARQMWMSYNSALAFKSSLSALGVSLQDLYLSPQLMSTFIQFQNLTKQMQAPADFQDVMNNLMKITFQFDQFKLEMVYGAQWIGYYLAKDLSGPLSDFEAGLQKINTMIITKMPLWTSKVASFIAMIGSFLEDIYTAGKDVVQVWDDLGESTQRAIEMFTGVGAAVMLLSSPIGQVLALLLLLDDYFGYEKGEQSAFPGLWKGIDDIEKKLKQTGAFDEMKTAVNELAESLIGKDGKGGLVGAFTSLFNITGMADAWEKALKAAFDVVSGLAGFMATSFNVITADIMMIKGLASGNQELIDQASEYLKNGANQNYAYWIDMMANGNKDKMPQPPGLPPNVPAQPSSASPNVPGKAAGGPASGPTFVGEKGVELVNLPSGSNVTSNQNLMAIWQRILNYSQVMATNMSRVSIGTQRQPMQNSRPVTIAPVYHIYGAKDPDTTARVVNQKTGSLMIRYGQGVIG